MVKPNPQQYLNTCGNVADNHKLKQNIIADKN